MGISTYLRAAVGVGSLALFGGAGGQNRYQNRGPFRGAPGVDFGAKGGPKMEAKWSPGARGPQAIFGWFLFMLF